MAHALPTQLSGGQQQRVAIARAMVHQPKLIVCDEPTSALDHETGQSTMELLRKVALHDGRALIVVTHDAAFFNSPTASPKWMTVTASESSTRRQN